jgi:glycine/D-amino acid oxidase-like deaminating enzyme
MARDLPGLQDGKPDPAPMAMPRLGVSHWQWTLATRPAAFERLRGERSCDVAVVGGGLTGTLAAHEFARAGARVVLLEAGRLGSGATGAGLGLVSPGPGVPFSTLRDRFGLRDARWIWETARRSALDLAAFLRRAGVRCDLTPVEEVLLAVGDAQIARLEREHQALKDAGLDVAWLPARRARASYGAEALAALKLGGASTIDPLRACLAVARRLHRAGGGLVFERSPVTRVRAARKSVTLTTTEGTVVASTVVLATGAPSAGCGALARHFREQQAYAVSLPPLDRAGRRPFGEAGAVARDLSDPPHAWRWAPGDTLLFSGVPQRPVAPRQLPRTLVQRTGQLMYELSLLYPHVSGTQPVAGWAVPEVAGLDGLPVVGAHRSFPRHLFALGFGRMGASGSWLAARLLVRQWAGEAQTGDGLLGFGR